jgi:hypothetical protein
VLEVGQPVRLGAEGTLAMDGEREAVLRSRDRADVRVLDERPGVLDVGAVLNEAFSASAEIQKPHQEGGRDAGP